MRIRPPCFVGRHNAGGADRVAVGIVIARLLRNHAERCPFHRRAGVCRVLQATRERTNGLNNRFLFFDKFRAIPPRLFGVAAARPSLSCRCVPPPGASASMGSRPRVNVAEIALAAPAAVASTLALDRGILAVPCRSGDVLIYNTHERDAPPEMLAGIHFSAVTALCFSWSPWPCLYTGAADGIARWSLEFVPAGLHDEDAHAALDAAWQQESELSSELLTTDLERAPVHVAVDVTGDRLAACVDCCTLIISCCSGKVLARLEGHHAPVSSAAFRSDHADSVITIGEDRRFIVYDLKAAALVYSSCIVSASPFISLAVADAGGRAAIGTSDGKVRLYDLATPDCRLLHTLDISSATNPQDQPWLHRRYAPAPAADSDGPVPVSHVHARARAYTYTHARARARTHTHTHK